MALSGKNVIIVGAGVSGLAAGIYAQRSGFSVTIIEQHQIPGGLSTSWSRSGYLFEGGMHWLSGSSPKLMLNRIWREEGALKDNNPVYNRDPFYTLVDGDKRLNLYRNVNKLKHEFLSFAPEDKKAIKKLCHDIRILKHVHLPVNDISGLKTKHHIHPEFKELLAMVPAVFRLNALTRQSYIEYVAHFKNEDIRHLLMAVIGSRYNALSFVYTLGSFASGDCGYPKGGSLKMTQNMAETFTSLGGKIEYSTTVEKVTTTDKHVTGIKVNSVSIPADAVIVAIDTRKAIDTLFDHPLNEKWTEKMRRQVVSEQTIFLCAGVKADLSSYPAGLVLPLKTPFKAAGLSFNELRINNYAQCPGHSPDGCTSLTCLLIGDSYDYWKARKADDTYQQEKAALMNSFLETVCQYIPEMKGNIEVTDVATPCTYERYTASFEGSWMSVWKPGTPSFMFPSQSADIRGLYFASERLMIPGGLPVCAWAGRKAAQLLCRNTNTEFRGSAD